jgi:hypothetical protein
VQFTHWAKVLKIRYTEKDWLFSRSLHPPENSLKTDQKTGLACVKKPTFMAKNQTFVDKKPTFMARKQTFVARNRTFVAKKPTFRHTKLGRFFPSL